MRLPSLRRNPRNRVRAPVGAAVTALEALAEPLESRTLLSAQLVKDVVPGPVGSQPSGLASLGDRLVFSTGGTQPGLWVSNGTDSGTQRISDAQVRYDSYQGRRPIVTSVAHNAAFF